MIKLSLEIPTPLLSELTPLTDLDFALAHQILENGECAGFHRSRSESRELILDNSMHELKRPLPVSKLHDAAKLCNADYVIAPDMLGAVEQNYDWFTETYTALSGSFSIGVVMCGRSEGERESYLRLVKNASMLLLPYREARLAWFTENEVTIRRQWKRVHLLGVSSLEEARAFAYVADRTPEISWSIDTSKPIKLALDGRRLDDGASIRNSPMSSKELLNLSEFSPEQMALIRENIDILRETLRV